MGTSTKTSNFEIKAEEHLELFLTGNTPYT